MSDERPGDSDVVELEHDALVIAIRAVASLVALLVLFALRRRNGCGERRWAAQEGFVRREARVRGLWTRRASSGCEDSSELEGASRDERLTLRASRDCAFAPTIGTLEARLRAPGMRRSGRPSLAVVAAFH